MKGNIGKLLLGLVGVTAAAVIGGTYVALIGKPLCLWFTFLWNLY